VKEREGKRQEDSGTQVGGTVCPKKIPSSASPQRLWPYLEMGKKPNYLLVNLGDVTIGKCQNLQTTPVRHCNYYTFLPL